LFARKLNTISRRLRISYLIIIFASLIGAMVCVGTLLTSAKIDSTISEVEIPSIEVLKELKHLTKEIYKLSTTHIYQANDNDTRLLATIRKSDFPELTKELKVKSEKWTEGSQKIILKDAITTGDALLQDAETLLSILSTSEDYSNAVKLDIAATLTDKHISIKSAKLNEQLDMIVTEKTSFLMEAQLQKEKALLILAITLVLVLIVIIATSYLMMQSTRRLIVKPIMEINTSIMKLGDGVIPKLEVESKIHEIQLMSTSINQMVNGIKSKIDFANLLGNGNYAANFDMLSKEDALGKALLEMRDKLKEDQEEILDKTKKITESINYSHRIQSSLLPTEDFLQNTFKDLFMFYKPKDVVSGDFPYFYKNEDYAYIATVDCTGHGVPGALMSFIGYFTLNQIMNENKHTKPTGQILDELHDKIQKTLRQDVNQNAAKDGMDVALCKINLKNLVLEFSGAHRPLYLVINDVFSEIKGDKYPIGGMHYKTRKPFISHAFQLTKGDSILFNTDGLPDQFGGNNGKEKFMSKRVRDLIANNKNHSMDEMKHLFENEFETWKGNSKQMDDVLMIGIKV
jgi:serine phosphatase RsbU (regulator of sigma subunit)